MPTKGNPRHAFRFDDGLWEAFQAAAQRDPFRRVPAVIVRDFVAWYARQRKTPAPKRPAAEVSSRRD